MKRSLIAVLAMSLFSIPAFAGHGKGAATKGGFSLIKSADLTAALTAEAKPAILDANGADTRSTEGKIAGARLLSNANHYNVAKELPSDKATKLVFYCYNEQCMASHSAAKRAVKAGYKDVAVLADGITGWKKAGGATEKVN